MYEWSDIRTFLAVMREGSAAQAALVLRTNQTTVSRRIARLEAALSLRLFEPGPRGALPTEAAKRLLPDAEAIEASANTLHLHAEGMVRRLSGTIRLTANPNVLRHAAGIVRQFQREHPDADLIIDTDHRMVSLEDGEADVALRPANRLTGDTLVARKLLDHPWGYYASKPYLDQHGVPTSSEDLAHHSVVRCTGEHAQVEPITTANERLGDHANTITIGSLDGVVGLLRAGEGVGILPRESGDTDPDLHFCFTEPDLIQGLWVVTTSHGHADPLIRAFLRHCAEGVQTLMRDLPREWRV